MPLEVCATPGPAPDYRDIDEIVSLEASAYLKLLVERHSQAIGVFSPGLLAFFGALRDSVIPFEAAWSAEFGWLKRIVRGDVADLRFGLVQAAILLSQLHPDLAWEAALDEPVRFRVGGMLAPAANAAATMSGELKLGRDGSTIFRAPVRGARALALAPSRGGFGRGRVNGQPVAIAPRAAHMMLSTDLGELPRSRARRAEMEASLAAAADFMDEVRTPFAPWIGRVVRDIIPLHSDAMIYSQSNVFSPGAVAISLPARRSAIAEMLIHEASHQYFHIAEMVMPVCEPGAPLYFSPVKNMARPLGRILLAYHAFVNVSLFYKTCREQGFEEQGYCARNLERHRPELEVMRDHLAGNAKLSEVGRIIAAPLLEIHDDLYRD